jgi:hypothetical protein
LKHHPFLESVQNKSEYIDKYIELLLDLESLSSGKHAKTTTKNTV